MRIALLGDLHFYRLGLWPWQMFSKRMLGQTNLWLNRCRVFDLNRLPALLEQVRSIQADQLLLAGDLTTTALMTEFVQARSVLEPLLKAHDSFVIPGNHDRYTFSSVRHRSFEKIFGDWSSESWPAERDLGEAGILLALDAARPRWLTARGELGQAQLQRLADRLDAIGPSRPVVILCHYPIGTPPGHPPEDPQHRLADADALFEILVAQSRPILYLHGHEHVPWCYRPAEASHLRVVDAGAPLHVGGSWPAGQGFWQIDADSATGEAVPWALTYHKPHRNGDWSAHAIVDPLPGTAASLDA